MALRSVLLGISAVSLCLVYSDESVMVKAMMEVSKKESLRENIEAGNSRTNLISSS